MHKEEQLINNYKKKQIMAIIAILILIPALWVTGIWVEVWNSHDELTRSARVSHFLDHFPSFMQTTGYVVVFNLVCSVASLILAARSFKQRSLGLRIVTILTAMAASLVIILTVFMIL